MTLSRFALRGKTLEGENLQNNVGLASSSRFAPLGYSFTEADLHFSTTPRTGRISLRADRTGYQELVDYACSVIDRLHPRPGRPSSSPFLAAFARPMNHSLSIWLLGSSLQSADLAARNGLPYAFASHFAPRFLRQAAALYRENFRPSAALKEPYLIVGANVIAAPTRAEAEFVASSHREWVSNLYAGKLGLLPKPREGFMEQIASHDESAVQQAMACTVVGDMDDVGSWLRQFIQTTQTDEVIINARIYDPVARCRSYQIAAEAMADLLS